MELALSLGLLGAAIALGAIYSVVVLLRGSQRHARLEREGASIVLGKQATGALYSVVAPVGRLAVRLHVTPNAVTWSSLVLSLGAGALLGLGRFGSAAVVAVVGSGLDALDGWLARETGTASDAGEVLDATVDRYGEFAFLAGLGFAFRADRALLLLVLGALCGSFMVSYATAKAEALRVEVSRGTMRRVERAVYLIGGVTLLPIVAALAPEWQTVPIGVALGLVALLGNGSAIHRLTQCARALRAREHSAAAEQKP